MDKQREIRTCKHHGETEFIYYESQKRWKCPKCQTEATQKRRDKVKEMSIEYKGGKCSFCGYSKCVGALEFHHLNPEEKEFGISAKGYTRSWETIKAELDKCIILCANCHREIHGEIKLYG